LRVARGNPRNGEAVPTTLKGMVNSGVDIFTVSKVLGHASVQSTQRYSHLANDTLLTAVEKGAAKQQLA
jgi:site-specific recombinase XerD